jgi:hypothetical protein
MKSLNVKELLETAGLVADGSVKWCEEITAAKRSVYIATIADPISVKLNLVPSALQGRWAGRWPYSRFFDRHSSLSAA